MTNRPLRLPFLKRVSLGSEPDAVVGALQRAIDDGSARQGYVRLETGAASHFLFILNGTCFCAGTAHDERFSAASLPDFFRALELRGRVDLCLTDLPLFLCTAVLFRKAPAAQLPSHLVDSAALLGQLQSAGKDAVLVIRLDDSRSLAFCHNGEPAALYPAEGEAFPKDGSVADRIIEYVYGPAAQGRVSIDLYEEIRLAPASHGGQRIERYRESALHAAAESTPAIVVRLGDRVVFRYPVFTDVITIGRGGQNDLALDNLSISRNHARVTRRGGSLVFEDLGSENGLVVKGQKVSRAALLPGDAVEVGKYTLEHRTVAPGEQPPEVRRDSPHVRPVDETIALASGHGQAALEHRGQRHRLSGQLFTLGKRPGANLRLKGLFVAGLHAQIEHDRQGAYFIRHVDGFTAVKVNGKAIDRVQLADRDEISIGGETFIFRLGEV